LTLLEIFTSQIVEMFILEQIKHASHLKINS
jgi:hypothetical protein